MTSPIMVLEIRRQKAAVFCHAPLLAALMGSSCISGPVVPATANVLHPTITGIMVNDDWKRCISMTRSRSVNY